MFFGVLLGCIILSLAGCCDNDDGDSSTPQSHLTQILSNPTRDGVVAQNSSGAFTVTQSNIQSVSAGKNPFTNEEFRAFLNFSLIGTGGVPAASPIVSATLDFVVNSTLPQPLTGAIPLRIDLISDLAPPLAANDFDRGLRPALASTTIPAISPADAGNHVTVDVTSLVTEARRLGLTNFQIRILEDMTAVSAGIIEINDTTGVNRELLAPVLRIIY
jgi:hypothetical protein